jgi:hypothetical protein
VKGWEKIFKAVLITDKVDFKLTLFEQDKEGHFMLIKGTIYLKKITIINLNAPNISASNFMKHTLKDLNAHIYSNTLVMGDFNTHLSPIGK